MVFYLRNIQTVFGIWNFSAIGFCWCNVVGSIDQSLRGKYYWRGLCCIMLWRDTLVHKKVNFFLENEFLSMFIKYNMETLRNLVYENKDILTSAYRESEMDNDIKLVVDTVYIKALTDFRDS